MIPAPRRPTSITRSGHRAGIEILFWTKTDETALPELPQGNDQSVSVA
jgi:hypothetical protein